MPESTTATINRQHWTQFAILAIVGIANTVAIYYLGHRLSGEQTKLNQQFWYDQQSHQQNQRLYDLRYDLGLTPEKWTF